MCCLGIVERRRGGGRGGGAGEGGGEGSKNPRVGERLTTQQQQEHPQNTPAKAGGFGARS